MHMCWLLHSLQKGSSPCITYCSSPLFPGSAHPCPVVQVTALVARGGGAPVEACTLLDGLDNPNGIAYDRGTKSLYVAEVRQLVMCWPAALLLLWHVLPQCKPPAPWTFPPIVLLCFFSCPVAAAAPGPCITRQGAHTAMTACPMHQRVS